MRLLNCLRWCDPVEAGQRKSAFFLSAALVMLWFLGRPSSTLAANCHGYVEDQYVRLEWIYDLDGGHGVITLDSNGPDWPPTSQRYLSFHTRGLPLTSVDAPTGGYLYSWSSDTDVNYALSTVMTFPISINVSFPTKGVCLFDTQLNYGVTTPDTPQPWVYNSLEFVSVEAIPEPKTAGLMAAAAACVGAFLPRRKRD